MKKLERNLIDNILESEVKLGCASRYFMETIPRMLMMII